MRPSRGTFIDLELSDVGASILLTAVAHKDA